MQRLKFTANKPYLFRATFEWLLDNNATPYLLVDTSKQQVEVPQQHIKDKQIVLNASPSAVQNWHVDNDAISFSARFSGVAQNIYIPMDALLAVYDQSTGRGMAFPDNESVDDISFDEKIDDLNDVEAAEPVKLKNKVTHLKVVK